MKKFAGSIKSTSVERSAKRDGLIRAPIYLLLLVSVFDIARANERLPSSIRNGIESGERSIQDYINMFGDCSVAFELAAQSHEAVGRKQEALRFSSLSDNTRSAVSYLLWATEQEPGLRAEVLAASLQRIENLGDPEGSANQDAFDRLLKECNNSVELKETFDRVTKLFGAR